VNLIKGLEIACVTFWLCVYFLKIDNICEMLISGKFNACALLHNESNIKTDNFH
jgi:hypothetical protein